MLSQTTSFTLDGISARPVRIEVDVHRGLPGFAVVGLPDGAARETRELIRTAIVDSGFEFPLRRIVVNVAPASLRGAVPSLGLAIAAALLRASGRLDWPGMETVALVGGLAPDGCVRAVDGALAMAEAARDAGLDTFVAPVANGPEAALARGIEVAPLTRLEELPSLASGNRPPAPGPLWLPMDPAPVGTPDLADLRGHPRLRHALEVAAAGGHGLLLVGTPGSDASMAASRLPSILPPLDEAEALEVVRIAGASGRLRHGVRRGRPFRAPHHTISAAGLVGGGIPTRPGEVTLAHRGVLFLDGIGEFRRDAIEALGAALDRREAVIERGGVRRRLPCELLLVAATTHCPSGRGTDGSGALPLSFRRLAGPPVGALADHLPLRVEVTPPTPAEIAGPPGESSAIVRERVVAARERAGARLGRGRTNAGMTAAEVAEVTLSPGAARLLAGDLAGDPAPGPRRDRTLRIARTVADLAGSEVVGIEAMIAALDLRGDEGPDAAA